MQSLLLFIVFILSTSAFQSHPFLVHADPVPLSKLQPKSRKSRSTATHLHATLPSTNLLTLLPTCSAANVNTLAATAGCVGLLSQLAIYNIFRRSKDAVISRNAGHTAHTIVALALMVLVSSIGLVGWFSNPTTTCTAAGRLLLVSSQARWLGAIITGMFLCWDIPTSIVIQKLRKPDMIVHHICTAVCAYVGAVAAPMHYLFYYLGVIEISSLPLLIYGQLSQNVNICTEVGDLERRDKLQTLQDKVETIAAISFTLVRVYSFTKVTLFNFIPDNLTVLPTAAAAGFARVLRFLVVASIGFTALQLYWFSTMLRVLFGKKDDNAICAEMQ